MKHTISNDRISMQGLTIDDPHSMDLDDAFWLEQDGDGHILHVSITDVAAVITPNSALDKAAQEKCFTRYLKHSSEPMLPKAYSEGSLSLFAGKERAALTISLPIDSYGQAGTPTIRQTLLTSVAKLSYAHAHEIMATPSHQFNQMLTQCHTFSQALFQQRRQNGAIALYNLKQGFATSEEGLLKSLSAEENYNSHIIIQEFMILLNESIAHFFAEHNIPGLYRNHTSKAVAPERNTLIHDVDHAMAVGDNDRINTLASKFALIFNKAAYAPVIEGHYALNLAAYMHITSPIRRYADLVNMRQLNAFLSDQPLPYTHDELVPLAEHLNEVAWTYKEKQSRFFKKAAYRKQAELLAQDDFSVDKDTDLYPLLKTAIERKKLPPNLQQILTTRLQNGELTLPEMMVLLLYADNDEPWQALKIQLLYWLGSHLHCASGIVTMALQKLKWSQPRYQTEHIAHSAGLPPRFFTQMSIQIKEEEFCSEPQKNLPFAISNKKTSQQLANLSLLTKIIGCDIDLVAAYQAQRESVEQVGSGDKSDNVIVTDSLIYQKDKVLPPAVNSVGKLVELCQQKGWAYPEYEYAQQGASHQPQFYMRASVLIKDKVYCSDEKQGSNKKTVKQLAAANLIDKVSNLPARSKADTSSAENFVGLLNDLCQKQQLDIPRYAFEEPEEGPFKCTCHLIDYHQVEQERVAYGSSKKKAKQKAAERMWKWLKAVIDK